MIEQDLINTMDALINSIKIRNPALTEEGIAVQMGYNEGYISQSRSRGKVSKKFLNQLAIFLERLQNANKVVEAPLAVLEEKRSLEKALENLTEDKLRTTAILERMMTLLELKSMPIEEKHQTAPIQDFKLKGHKKNSPKAV